MRQINELDANILQLDQDYFQNYCTSLTINQQQEVEIRMSDRHYIQLYIHRLRATTLGGRFDCSIAPPTASCTQCYGDSRNQLQSLVP